jgi:transcriptional regulator GlxA family with amidase domain
MVDVFVVVLPGAFASSVAITLDVLAAAQTLAPRLSLPTPSFRVVGAWAGPLTLGNGMQVPVEALPSRLPAGRPMWLVPGLGTADATAVREALGTPEAAAIGALLQRAHAQGHEVAASCAAVLLLGAHGLLDRRQATCTWWLAPELRRVAPACGVDSQRMVIHDRGVFTAGAAMAHLDLMLAVLRHRFGRPLAEMVAQALLIASRPSQSRYVQANLLALGDELVTRIEALVREAMPAVPTVDEIARRMAMSTRTLHRRVRAATGRSPIELVQSVRLTAAKALLQSTRLSVEQVAERVGYQDTTSLRRLMKQAMSATPSQLRS